MRKIRNVFLLLSLLSLVSLISYRLGENSSNKFGLTGTSEFNLSKMWYVKGRLETLFLEKDKFDDKKMAEGAISGMVSSLEDPYTFYLPAAENKSANEDLAGQFGGVGISLGYKDKTLSVMAPLAKTPAERAGLQSGDLILKITDKNKKIEKNTVGISLQEAVEIIRGKIGTEVTLNMYRESSKETFDVTLKRENIVVPSIELEFKEKDGKKVAWVKLYKFTDLLYKEWGEIVTNIKKENTAGIVLDLRNNPGGYLQASVMVASDFLKSGIVVSQESSDGSKEDYVVDKTLGRLVDTKVVVLVNGGSASASEILAGALKEYKRATLVGEKTFGKGTVQQPEDFSDGSGIHVTIARWLLPNGVNIHKVGVSPDVEVVDEPPKEEGSKADNQLDKAIEVLLKQ
jgi:carboxyl-terminal processing protease